MTGLVGTLVLQNNGANNLTVTANGGFTFPGTVPSGSPYSISVLSQPSGPSCTISEPSGMATSNIAVSVSSSLIQITNTVGPSGLSAGFVSSISVALPAMPTSTPLKDATGAPFAVSSGVVYANSYDISPNIGYVRAQTDAHYLAYFYDLSKSLMVAVPVDTSDVLVMGVPN